MSDIKELENEVAKLRQEIDEIERAEKLDQEKNNLIQEKIRLEQKLQTLKQG